ncbi:MAG: 2,3-cyclic 3-phosphodiesterase [Gaiellaceae bacterium]|nr:2,3-cyclic 3-phosphodiesterase [Gaiellaceae bacterium]
MGRIRSFIALDLPEGVKDEIAAWQRAELSDPALWATDRGALHATLCFLGNLDESQVAEVEAVLADVEPGAVEMRLEARPRPLPPRGRPRLFTLAAPSEDAVRLQAELSELLVARGLYTPGERKFWPHITVARVRPERRATSVGRRRVGPPMRVAAALGPLHDAVLGPFKAVRLTFYRSNLRSQGAEYVPLASIDLTSRRKGPDAEGVIKEDG